MPSPQKYLFDTDFGSPRIAAVDMTAVEDVVEEVEEAEPPPPTFSEEELTLARDQAFEAGKQAGLEEAAGALEQMIGMALATCAHHLQSLSTAQQAAAEATERHAVAVALAVLRKLHPEFCRLHGVAEIEAAIKDSLAHLDHVARITIKVHPALVDAIKEKSEHLVERSSFDGKLIVIGDQGIVPGDCRLDWGDGGADRDQARTLAEIDRVVEATLGTLQASLAEA